MDKKKKNTSGKKNSAFKKYLLFGFFVISFCALIIYVSVKNDDGAITSETLNSNEQYMVKKMASTSSIGISSVNVSGNIATITSYGSVSGYYIGYNNSNISSAYYSGNTDKNIYYASVKNGTYYFWVSGTGVGGSTLSPVRYANAVTVNSSCVNENVVDGKGTIVVQRCGIIQDGALKLDADSSFISCAAGYTPDTKKIIENQCAEIIL